MKTKVLFFLPNLHGGGAERVSVNIIKQLDIKKFDITLVLVQKEGEFLELIPDYINIINLNSKKVMFSIFSLRKVLVDLNPDILYTTSLRTHIVVYLALKGIKNKPTVINRSPNSPKLLIENNQLSYIWKKLLEKAYLNANIIIAQTPEMQKEISSLHHIDAEKIVVLLNPIDINTMEKKVESTINPFKPEFINVIAAGRLTEQKGFDILIKSFEKVISKNNKFRLHIIGHGLSKEKETLESLISSCNMNEYIKLLGFQKNPYKFFYYSNLYVLSSKWEGLPNTVLENLYFHKPIVATRCIPYMDTLINDGKNGLLVAVADIEALALAILNYKVIDTSFETIKFDSSAMENIFLNQRNH